MNAELEVLLKALDALITATDEGEKTRAQMVYESRLDDVIGRFPNFSRAKLEQAIRVRYAKWIAKGERMPSTLPPKA